MTMNVNRPAEFLGTWKLTSMRLEQSRGRVTEPLGANVIGYLTYTESGHVHCMIAPAARPKLGSEPDEFAARDGLARLLFALPKLPKLLQFSVSSLKTVSYAGTWEVKGESVFHHADVAGLPDWDGTDIVRGFEIGDTSLRLIAQFVNNRVLVDWVKV